MPEIVKVSYTHDAMIDLIIASPAINQRTIAAKFGYSEAWISTVFCSDSFKKRLAERKAEIVDPVLVASIEERLEGLARLSMEVLMEKIEAGRSPTLAIQALDISTKARQYGARNAPVVQNNFVVALPPKSADSDSWAQMHAPVAVQ